MNYITFTRINTMKKKWYAYKKQKEIWNEKLRLDDYQFESEEKEEQQTGKKLDKKMNLMNRLIKNKQAKTVNYFRNIFKCKDDDMYSDMIATMIVIC